MKFKPYWMVAAWVGMTATLCPPTVHAEAGRFYARVDLGPAITPDVDIRQFMPNLVPSVDGNPRAIEFDPGIRLGFGGGYYFADWVALELETGVSVNQLDRIKGSPSVNVRDSSIGNIPFMGNVVFEVPTATNFRPFAGAGAGISLSYFYADFITDSNGLIVDGEETDAVFAYQLFGGVRYSLNDHMHLGLAYRYFSTEAPAWEVYGDSGLDWVELDRINTHSVSFSFTMSF